MIPQILFESGKEQKNLMITDFRTRHTGIVLSDGLSEDNVLNEIQNSLTEISPFLSLKSLNLLRPAERSYLIQPDDPELSVVPHNIESIVLNTMKFNKDQ